MADKEVQGPGKAHREGITLIGLMDLFPDEKAATYWFEKAVWGDERSCGHCGSLSTSRTPNAKPMPYWCPDCRSYFSVRTGTGTALPGLAIGLAPVLRLQRRCEGCKQAIA